MNMDYTQLTDEVLFNRYSGGDLKAFDVLMRRHKGLIYSLILRFVRNSQQADELFQDVFLKICKNRDQFREAVSFKSWMVTICRNTCIDHVRHIKRIPGMDSFDAEGDEEGRSLSEKIASSGPQPLETLTINFENQELTELMDKLPAEQRETFALKILGDLTFEEIGGAMNVSVNTAKSRYRYALETLRGQVNRKRLLDKIANE
jgi:RNA polymerase sigma factor (sigma-70 family)